MTDFLLDILYLKMSTVASKFAPLLELFLAGIRASKLDDERRVLLGKRKCGVIGDKSSALLLSSRFLLGTY